MQNHGQQQLARNNAPDQISPHGIARWSQGAEFTLEILLPAEMVPAAGLTPAKPRAAISRPLISFSWGGGWGQMVGIDDGCLLGPLPL